MNRVDLFAYGDKCHREGNTPMAVNIWNDLLKQDPHLGVFAAVHLNLADIHKKAGNAMGERGELIAFLNSVQTGITLDLLPNAKARLQEIDAKLAPQPQPQTK